MGDYKDSATNFPLVRLQAAEGHRLWTLPGTEMSATGVTVSIPASTPPGAYVLSVFANAIGGGRMVRVVQNTAPVAQDLTGSTPYGVPVNLSLVATDAEAGPPLSFVIVTPPAHGTLSGTPPSVTYTPASGYLGPDSFTFRVRDCGLDSNVATVTLGVADQTPPDITCPVDQAVEAMGPGGALVSYPPATATDVLTANPTVTYSLPSGSTLPLGDTAVTATAEDAAGNRASCSFQVTVRDTTPPALSCPEDVRVSTAESAGTSVTYVLPEPTDLVSSSTVIASPASGSHFPKGETRVSVTATDAAGNAAQCSFNVTVQAREESSSGCGCQADGGGAGAALVVLSALATWAGRRRRRERVTP